MTASMNWYSMSDSIQSVRVMGVVDSFLMMPFCLSSVFKFTVPNRLNVITAIAMMPGMKNSMKRYFLVSIDVLADLMNGGVPDIFWFIPAITAFRICIFVNTEEELGSYIYVMVTDALGSPSIVLCKRDLS